ncbi:MAG: FHA domain-containing protein [Myxococcota bacterium]|nr:FHA domain-containing protein [Myxococcota bacterium]
MGAGTQTDASAGSWLFEDDLVRLRVWGTDHVYPLPSATEADVTIGTSETCAMRIADPDGVISRTHCRLRFEHRTWVVRDLQSKNGTFIDGTRRDAGVIAPGVEIRIGKATLLAESPRSIELHGFLARLLGWRSDRRDSVDHALRAVRLAATRRAALVLCGDGDLVPIAFDLHRRVFGAERPFVSCDPKRRESEATVRSVQNFTTGLAALDAARSGTLCVWSKRLPRDFNDVAAALRHPSAQSQLVVVAHTPAEARSFIVAPIEIPSLRSRSGEVERIIDEYAAQALASWSVAGPFLPEDRAWVRTHSAESLLDIEKGTRRLVALRRSDSIAAAAALLGMAPASLQEWIGRRSLPKRV